MTPMEIKEAMLAGHSRFVSRSGKIYWLDPAQEECIRSADDDVLLIGYPEKKHLRQRGRAWQWLAPRNLRKA